MNIYINKEKGGDCLQGTIGSNTLLGILVSKCIKEKIKFETIKKVTLYFEQFSQKERIKNKGSDVVLLPEYSMPVILLNVTSLQ